MRFMFLFLSAAFLVALVWVLVFFEGPARDGALHVSAGMSMVSGGLAMDPEDTPPLARWVFVVAGGVFALYGLAIL